jgi:hypothetical protein
MKTSNKILIIYLSLFALVMLTGAFSWRYSKPNTKRGERHAYSVEHTHTVPEFKYVKLSEIGNATFITSDVPQLIVYNNDRKSDNEVKYHLSGDTLIVSSKASNQNKPIIEIRNKQMLLGIIASDSEIFFKTIPDSSFSLYLNSANFYDLSGVENVHDFKTLRIHVQDQSNVNIHNYTVNHLEVFSDRSYINVNKVNKLSGEMKNRAGINCSGVQDISLKREEGCNLNIY